MVEAQGEELVCLLGVDISTIVEEKVEPNQAKVEVGWWAGSVIGLGFAASLLSSFLFFFPFASFSFFCKEKTREREQDRGRVFW